MVQETRAHTRVQLVADEGFAPDAVAQIVSGFKQRLGAEVSVEVNLVDNIPAEKSGKFRYIISHA